MNRTYKIICCISFIIAGGFGVLSAQTSGNGNTLNYPDFLENIKINNIGYIIEKYNVDIANANIEAAKIFPDPSLSVAATDNQEQKMEMGYSIDAGLDYTFELGGKRKARMRLAQSEAALTNALLEAFFRNLRADATLNYLSALKQKQLVLVQKRSYRDLQQLAKADSIRFSLGSIMDVDARQSKLEADMLFNEVLQSEAELHNTLMMLSMLQGNKLLLPPDSLAGTLPFFAREFDLHNLIVTAQNNRSDLQVALLSKEVSQRNLQLAKANRAIDLGVNVGVSRNSEVRNEIAPAPAFTAVSAGISIPLRLSNINKGEINAAKFAIQQSEAGYNEVELQIQLDVVQAYMSYMATRKQVERYNTGMLAEARIIFDRKAYSYERGNTSLFEVLDAQRTYNEVQQNYYETLYNCAAALIELERACGIWDIEL